MKSIHTLALLMFATSMTYSQSSIVSQVGTNIEVGSGADICADTIVIGGTFSGGGTRCVQTPASIDYAVLNGWNMVSVPFTENDYARTVLYPRASSRAFAYQNGYTPEEVLANGNGYWLKFDAAVNMSIAGFVCLDQTIAVQVGWNIIGSISSSVATSSITSNPPGITTSNFFGYNGNYVQSTTIDPGQAYWVKVSQNGSLILSSPSQLPSTNRIRIVPTNELPPPAPDDEPGAHLTSHIPRRFSLEQNYPNPFNPSTVVRYQLPAQSYVTLKIFDLLGQEVAVLVDEMQDAGYKSVEWSASALTSGVYYSRLQAGSFIEMKKLLLLK